MLTVPSLLTHWYLLITWTHDFTISLTPKLAVQRYLIGNLTFHYLIGLCSSPTTATCSKAPTAVIQSLLEALSLSPVKKTPCNVHLKHKYVSNQVARPVAAITAMYIAKACEDDGLINMGCLTLTLMLMGFSKIDLQLKALVFRCSRKITIGESLSNVIFLVELVFLVRMCVYMTQRKLKINKKLFIQLESVVKKQKSLCGCITTSVRSSGVSLTTA